MILRVPIGLPRKVPKRKGTYHVNGKPVIRAEETDRAYRTRSRALHPLDDVLPGQA